MGDDFPARKRRPSDGGSLSRDMASLRPLTFILKKTSASVIRKARLVSILLEEFTVNNVVCPSTVFCLEELYMLVQIIRKLIEDCSSCSKMWLLMQVHTVSDSCHQLTVQLWTLMDILLSKDLKLNDDVRELLQFIRNHCLFVVGSDSSDEDLRAQVGRMLANIKKEIVPDHAKLSQIFKELELTDSVSCSEEIERLEYEVRNQKDDRSKADVVALIELVRYAKCVLYGVSTPRSIRQTAGEVNIPADFRCPISLELMRDPVVVSTGQTYDKSSISHWIESGHKTCPKTGQALTHTLLIPNLALKNLIALWCRNQRISFDFTEFSIKPTNTNNLHKTAIKMTISFLVNELQASQTTETINRVVHELRILAKTDSDNRMHIADAEALPVLAKLSGSEHPDLQVNAITTILNLSILEANKTRIMETEGVLNGIIEVLRCGATWEAKGNAAATIFSLTGIRAHGKKLGKKTRMVKALLELARCGPTSPKRDAMMAILNLAGDRECIGKLIEGGVIAVVGDVMESLAEEALAVLQVVVKRGGLSAVSAAYKGNMVDKLTRVMRDGSDRAKEYAAATLVIICRRGGSEMVANLAAVVGIERLVWEIMGNGSGRARRKAATLLRILRRWAAGPTDDLSATVNIIVLPA